MTREELEHLQFLSQFGGEVITPELNWQVLTNQNDQVYYRIDFPEMQWPTKLSAQHQTRVLMAALDFWVDEIMALVKDRPGWQNPALDVGPVYGPRILLTVTNWHKFGDSWRTLDNAGYETEFYLQYFELELICRERVHLLNRYLEERCIELGWFKPRRRKKT